MGRGSSAPLDDGLPNNGKGAQATMMPFDFTTTSTVRKPRCAPSEVAAAEAPLAVHLFQIAYSPKTLSDVEDGYGLLDNTENPRPDWFEYWPIRSYLLNEMLDEDAFYGFFSTRFRSKTNLGHAEVVDFVRRHAEDADILLFSPQPDMGAFFFNVFEQAELFDPGLIETVNLVLTLIGMPLDVTGLIMDSRQIVFSNYFVARPRFWREWLRINELLYEICEGPANALKNSLCQPTTYPGAAQRKVFVQERIASLVLTSQPHWRSVAYNPFGMAWSMSRFRDYPIHAYISDALKSAYRANAYSQYIEAYAHVRTSFQNGTDIQGRPLSSSGTAKPAKRSGARRNATLTSCLRSRMPIIVPTYNNPTYARDMVDQLRCRGLSDIIMVDNNSDSDEMIELLTELDTSIDVIRLDGNRGPHHVFVDESVFEALPQVFCLTDPDIRFNPKMPDNFLEVLLSLTEKHSIGKAGLALDISDKSAMRQEKTNIGGQDFHTWEWEKQFWINEIDTVANHDPVYLAEIDTTFALYNKKFFSKSAFYRAVRVAGDFTSLHLPWYRANGMTPKEDAHYRATQQHSYYVK